MAISDPTERSMPPVAITSVIPTPTIATVATWVRLTFRVRSVRKLSVKAMLKAIRASSARSAAAVGPGRQTRRDLAAAGDAGRLASGRIRLAGRSCRVNTVRLGTGGDQVHHRRFTHLVTAEFSDAHAVAENYHAVTAFAEFF